MSTSERSEKAISVARQYRGEVDGKVNDPPPFSIMEGMFPDYLDMTEEYLLADVMARPGLSMREHSMIIIVALMVIRFEGGMKGHMNWALNVGLTREEVVEIVMHASRYGGWPDGEEILQLIDEAYPGFLENANENPLEKVWSQPGLTEREQSMITMAAYVALRFSDRLKVLIGEVLDNGLSREEIQEVIIQVTAFSGWPVGVEALRMANEVFASKG